MALRSQLNHEKNAVINREQQYNEYYRVWEVSQLDCLIREQKDLQKSISVEGVNQYVAQGYSFAKLWKLPDSGDRKIQKINKQEKVNIAEDEDEEDEPVVKSDAEVHYNCGFEEMPVMRPTSLVPTVRTTKQGLCTGLFSTLEIYGFDCSITNEANILKYAEHTQHVSYRITPKDSQVHKFKKLSDMRSRKLPDYWNVQPLSLFTMDNAFKMEIPEVSKMSLKIYKDVVERFPNGYTGPSPSDRKIYEICSIDK